ncbi:MAG: hypothetical protein NC293_05765 [Roseburia sp.]|nr:hypothetical protein [Roseburia sp.]
MEYETEKYDETVADDSASKSVTAYNNQYVFAGNKHSGDKDCGCRQRGAGDGCQDD